MARVEPQERARARVWGLAQAKCDRRTLLLGLAAFSLAACGGAQAVDVPTLPSSPPQTPTPAVAATPTPIVMPTQSSLPLDDKGFADPAFRALWERTDGAVASGKVTRAELWGQPVPFGARREPYAEAKGGERLVQYFDKGRMEINDPTADPKSEWYVTSGLLPEEMVSGRVQVGDGTYQTLEPAQLPVTGDLESPSPQTPRYADYNGARRDPVATKVGQAVTTKFVRGASDQEITPPTPVKNASFDQTLGHNIPDVFMNYFNGDLAGMGLNWLFVMGHPLSEPYWITINAGDKTETVLVQLFERRALSYTPAADGSWQVEFTNIGLHYYRWRYHDR